MKIFHGSENRIEKPEYGKGKPYNDYGLGFYCTEDIEMAKEWSCGEDHDGFANEYTLDITGLKVLNLNAPEYTILHWLAVLLKNRTFRLTNPIAKDATGVSNESTIDAIRKGGEEKQRILKEMMLADLGICNVELSGTKEKPIISTVHQLTNDSGERRQYTLLLGQESVGTQRFECPQEWRRRLGIPDLQLYCQLFRRMCRFSPRILLCQPAIRRRLLNT